MLFVVIFEDNPEKSSERTKHISAHLDFLGALGGKVKCAGPLMDPETKTALGGIWIVNAESAGEVEDLVKADPLFSTGLRKSYSVKLWRSVFGMFEGE